MHAQSVDSHSMRVGTYKRGLLNAFILGGVALGCYFLDTYVLFDSWLATGSQMCRATLRSLGLTGFMGGLLSIICIHLPRYLMGCGVGAVIGLLNRRGAWLSWACGFASSYFAISLLSSLMVARDMGQMGYLITRQLHWLIFYDALIFPSVICSAWAASRLRSKPPSDEPRCAGCGYLLRGLTSPRCPECGLAITETAPQ